MLKTKDGFLKFMMFCQTLIKNYKYRTNQFILLHHTF